MRGILVILLVALCAAAEQEEGFATVVCDTTKGSIRIVASKLWSPQGFYRFLHLVDDNYFTNHAMYRAVDDFLVQFGIAADPKQTKRWADKSPIPDDQSDRLMFRPGVLSYAGNGVDSRGTSMFITTSKSQEQLNYFGNNPWETPFGFVTEGLDNVLNFYTGYGDMAEQGGNGPSQEELETKGNEILTKFPKLDYINTCKRVGTTEADRKAVDFATWPRNDQIVDRVLEATFVNNHADPLDLYYAPEGEEEAVYIASLKPKETIEQSTYHGHSFLFVRRGDQDHEEQIKFQIEDGKTLYSSTTHTEL